MESIVDDLKDYRWSSWHEFLTDDEEDDSQYNPEDEEWLTYVEQDEYAKYPEY